MAWAVCQHPREDINVAGQQLNALPHDDPRRNDALEIINNWRSCHGFPLQIIKMTLLDRAKTKINPDALVAQRIKRLSSISLKLRHNPLMRLSQMQDIGGCRAVLTNVNEVERLVTVYEEAHAKNPNSQTRSLLIRKFDYITEPKDDGYRSVHLIMRYQSASSERKMYNGQKIEIQIRSNLQHAWATAVETCQAFTGQALKSKIKSASETWLLFFKMMSSAIASREKRPIVPGTPSDKGERREHIRRLESQANVITMLRGWNTAIKSHETRASQGAVAYLLELNTLARMLTMTAFRDNELHRAQERYLVREKETETNPNIQIVLVSTDSVAALKRAYPNYYVDTTKFIDAIRMEIGS